MGKHKATLSAAKQGMNRSTAPYSLEEAEYIFALNSNVQDEETGLINLTNEQSNILSHKFKEGFTVIGKKNDIISNGTYFFLVNEETGESEIGIVRDNQIPDETRLDDLDQPLEDIEQVPYLEYETIINGGLDFNINYPVRKIVLKNEQCGRVLVFTDNLNPPRLIELDNLEKYITSGKEVDPNKIAIFKRFFIPEIDVDPIVTGGRLKRGTYEFLMAYTDKLGNEISEYVSITNPISIFDKNNNLLEYSELADRTNFAIKLNIRNIDTEQKYYKIVVIQNTDIEGGVTFYEEGIHPVSDNTIIYSTDENKIQTSLDALTRTIPNVKKWEGVTESNGYLFGYGITSEKELNLQPVVNLMGSFLKWQTSIAKESLYESGDSTSKYRGYMRNETYPFSIRFISDSGYKTALFPFVNRPSGEFETQEGELILEDSVAPDNKDKQSILKNNPKCSTSNRNKYWQYYNTASKEGQRDVEIDYTTVSEPVTKNSYIDAVGVIPSKKFRIQIEEEFTTLENYIEDNISTCGQEGNLLNPICSFFDVSQYPENKIPTFEDCDTPELISEEIAIDSISPEGGKVTLLPKVVDDYLRVALNAPNSIYEFTANEDGDLRGVRRDPERKTETSDVIGAMSNEYAFEKVQNFTNTNCKYALPLQRVTIDRNNISGAVSSTGFFNDIIARDTKAEILTEYKAKEYSGTSVDGVQGKYYDHVHVNALWFRGRFDDDEDVKILEITKAIEVRGRERYANRDSIRVTIFNSCDSFEYSKSIKVDPEEGLLIELNKEELGITGDEFLVAIDTLTMSTRGLYAASSFHGLYGVHMRPREYSAADIAFDEIVLNKKQRYQSTCRFKLPQVDECQNVPFEYGKFGYTESLEKYPDNKELYDSTGLNIDLTKIPEDIKDDFKKYFIKTNPDGSYELNENANLTNKPIRHFKFPDNDVAPFISDTQQASFSESIIFPIGVHIDDEVVSSFLDIAVDNGLLTEEQRSSIVGYEIFRGDRTLEKSIEAKGLLYDNYKVQEKNEQVYFPNFPYNSLGTNALLYKDEQRNQFIEHPFDSEGNNSFSFHSPDNTFRKLSNPTELQVEGYQFGNSRGYISDVEDHPKWTILGDKAYALATSLATAETIAEIVIQVAQATIETSKNMWFQAGFVVGGNPVGSVVGGVATAIIAGFEALSNSVFKIARYRQEWLTIFKDLGQPENFAGYFTSEGHYNSLKSLRTEGNYLRGLDTFKNLNSGRFSFRHKDSGERVILNNTDRESSSYLYLGEDFNLEYPLEYREYDNYDTNFNYASRPIASEENACETGLSKEIISNIASPYVSLKNYVPSQYGTVDAIKWIPTSYTSYFEGNKDTTFGGDIFISRMTLKRKMPLFLRNAMKQASLVPFNYGFYSNIGDNRFFCNYEVSEEINLENSLFPDFKSTYNFDCNSSSRGFYIKPPSKFYLFYYGIPSFLVESEINLNYRYGKKTPEGNFFPNVSDIVEWTQETNTSIKEQNTYFYDFRYSKNTTSLDHRTLPFTYSKEEYDCRYDSPNGVMYSLPDNSEKDLNEPWLVFRPLDTYNFKASYGKLKDLTGIENNQVLGRFENQTAIFNAVDVMVDGINSELGDGGIFKRRPVTFNETELGYLGSQSYQMVSCEYGHFSVDALRGQVFKIAPGGKQVEEISKYTNGKPNGMDKWFKKHLPFKVYNPLINNYEDIDTDNAYNGIGITMGWDANLKRIFITKKDYEPLQEMNYENGFFFATKDELELITDYEADGYTYLGKEGMYYKFNKPSLSLPKNGSVVVLINTNDYTSTEAFNIKNEVIEWVGEDTDFNGDVIFVTTNSDRWLKNVSELIDNDFSSLVTGGAWNSIENYQGLPIGSEVVFLNFAAESDSYYTETEPTVEFINDYKAFRKSFDKVDYFKNLIVTKGDSNMESNLDKVLSASDEYKDYAIRGTNPQMFIEPLSTYGNLYDQYNTNLQEVLNSSLGDQFDKGSILIKGDTIKVTDTEFFKDVSWTIAYQVEMGSWVSYYSYKPNYYLNHNLYFQTGVNLPEGSSVWDHGTTNRSYQVFYGEKFPWIVEYPIKNEFATKRLENVTIWTESKNYLDEHDFAYDRHTTFNHAVIYNNYENSGRLNLIPQKTLSQVTKYPIKREKSQDILITNQDYNWTFNTIYNRTLNQDGVSRAWTWDENQIGKEINHDLVQFGGKKILSYLRGDYFIVRLEQDGTTERDITLKWATNTEEIY